jgi:DNA/RNA endonuclease YhcR with UshA esterase domain
MIRTRFLNFILLVILIFSGFFFVWGKPTMAEWASHLVISEVQVSENEFVELYNPTSTAIDLYNNGNPFYFSYFSKDRDWNNPYRNKPFPEGANIPAYGFYLIGLRGYTTSTADWVPYTSAQLNDTVGAVVIFPWDPTTKSAEEAKNGRIDALGWGDVTYVKEGTIISAPSQNNSLERRPANNYGNGEDTENNAQDFILQNSPNPQNSQSQVELPQPPTGPTCGNNIKEGDEECDGTDLAGQTCITRGFVGGTLSCNFDCTFNTSNCAPILSPGGGGGNTLPASLNPSDIVINEFVSDPVDGQEEWVELYNNTDQEIDLTNWKIEEGSGAQTNLSGVISPKDFFVIEKIKGYLNNPGDIIKLIDPNGKIIDQVVYGNWDDGNKGDNASTTTDPNSIARVVDGQDTDRDNLDFKVSTIPTKGQPNKFSEEKEYPFGVIINEILPNPKGDDSENEFIELKNITNQEIDLDGWKIEDVSGIKFIISSKNLISTKISAKGFFVIYRKDSKIALNNSGNETIKLYQPNDNLVDLVSYSGSVAEDISYAKDEKNDWFWSTSVTPNQENIIQKINQKPKAIISAKSKALVGEEIVFDASDSYDPDGDNLTYLWDFGDGIKGQEILVKHIYKKAGAYNAKLEVRDSFGETDSVSLKIEILEGENNILLSNLDAEILITEFLPNPKGSDENEWIEIYNTGEKEIDLSGWFLDDIDGGSKPYKIKEGTKILPGQYLVFGRKETKIALNNNFDSVRILDPEGNLFYGISYEKPKEDFSFALDENGEWHWTSILTPEAKNIFSQEVEEIKTSKTKIALEKEKILEIPLSEVRNQDFGDLVKTQGVVSVEPGILGTQIFYLNGSGIQVYFCKKDFPNLRVGDRVEVIGELAEFKGESRIKVSSRDDIKILKNEAPPQPKEVKTGEIDEGLEGGLVLVTGQLIESRTNYFYLDDGSGEVKVYLKAAADIKKPKMKEGEWLRVVGVVGQYGEEYRIFPRYQSDIELIKEPNKSDKLQMTGALSGVESLFEKINSSSKVSRSEKVKYLSLSALALMVILVGLLIKKKRGKTA